MGNGIPYPHHIQGLKLAHPIRKEERFNISLLIGADFYLDFVMDNIIRGDGPTAVESKLGYLLSGPLPNQSRGTTTNILHVLTAHEEEERNLQRFWDLESIGIKESNSTKSTEIQRYYFTEPVSIFVDASTKAYGATGYIVQGSHTSLVMSKTRVAPIKKLTLPQLELMAALIGARIASHITSSLNNSFNVTLWSDSQIVLHWITGDKPLKTFVKNRTLEIKKLFSPTAGRYCPTTQNPADLFFRTVDIGTLLVIVKTKLAKICNRRPYCHSVNCSGSRKP